jgi:Raf kinase inhibitor-like YbhB/YbcL family protein
MKLHYASLALLAVLALQPTPPERQTTPPAQQTTSPAQLPSAPQPQRGGGRGGGRGGVQLLTITTNAWADGGAIPGKYAQPGHDVSPLLAWSWSTANPPDNIASFVLIVHDLDAPVGNGAEDLLQWLLWNIPGTARQLPEGVPQGGALPDGTRQISATGPNYRGPAAPASGPSHHYVFELFALDTMLDVPAVGATPVQTRAAVVAAMAGHVRGKGVYIGTYHR